VVPVYRHGHPHLVPHPQYLLQNDAAGRVDIVIFPEHPVLVGLGRGAADDLVLARPPQVDIHTQHVSPDRDEESGEGDLVGAGRRHSEDPRGEVHARRADAAAGVEQLRLRQVGVGLVTGEGGCCL